MSRRSHIIDQTCLLMLLQTERYGRWHIEVCSFEVGPLHRTHSIIPPIITDLRVYISTRKTGRPGGYRLRTQEEAEAYHRDRLACWAECSTIQDAAVPDNRYPGMPTQRHIITACTPRCLAVQQSVRDSAALVGISVNDLRALAVRRHKSRRYTGDVPYGSRARGRARACKP